MISITNQIYSTNWKINATIQTFNLKYIINSKMIYLKYKIHKLQKTWWEILSEEVNFSIKKRNLIKIIKKNVEVNEINQLHVVKLFT
jgi:hypothetical protein